MDLMLPSGDHLPGCIFLSLSFIGTQRAGLVMRIAWLSRFELCCDCLTDLKAVSLCDGLVSMIVCKSLRDHNSVIDGSLSRAPRSVRDSIM